MTHRLIIFVLLCFSATAQTLDNVDTVDELIEWADKQARRPDMVAVQSIEFNNGIISEGGLLLTLTRAGTAYDESGLAVSANTARYGKLHTVAGAPTNFTTINGFDGVSFRPLASGFDTDGITPIMVVRQGRNASTPTIEALHIHVRSDPENYYNAADSTNSYVFVLAPDGSTDGDILYGQTSVNGGTAAIADHRFVPKASYVHNGLIIIKCDHQYDDGLGFDSVGVAFAYTTTSRLGSSNPWIMLAVTETVNIGPTSHGQSWSLTGFQVSDTRLALLWTDYGTSTRDGGNVNLTVADLTNGIWSFETCRLADNYRAGGSDDEHFHTAGLIIDSNGNWIVVVSVGDGFERNRLIYRILPAADVAAGNFGSGSTYVHGTYGSTGINGSFVIQSAHANWSPEAVAWGGVSTTAGRAARHNQVINMVQRDAACTQLLCGTDETSESVFLMSWDETDNIPIWDSPYISTLSSANGDGVVNFKINGQPDGPFVAKVGADSWDDSGTGGSGVADLEACIIYSANGLNWTQILDWQQAAQYPALIHANKIYLGTIASGTPKYLSLPKTDSRRPLQVADSVTNNLGSVGASSFTGEDSTVVISDLASDLSDLPAAFNGEGPPCHRNNMMLWNATGAPNTDQNHLGQATIASGLPDTFTDICVKAWVRAVPYDGTTFNNKSTASIWSRLQKTTSPNPASPGGTFLFDSERWYPLTLWFNKSQFNNTFSGSWNLRWQLRANGLNTNSTPSQFVMAIEGVYLDSGLIKSNGASAALVETAVVTGINKYNSYSVVGVMEIPFDQWDNRTGGGSPGSTQEAGSSISSANKPTLALLSDSASSDVITIFARPDINEVELTVNATTSISTGNDKWWRRGDTFIFVLTCNGTNTTITFESTDGTIKTLTVADAIQFNQIISDDPILWHKFLIKEGIDPDPVSTLQTLGTNTWWQNNTQDQQFTLKSSLRHLRFTTTQK